MVRPFLLRRLPTCCNRNISQNNCDNNLFLASIFTTVIRVAAAFNTSVRLALYGQSVTSCLCAFRCGFAQVAGKLDGSAQREAERNNMPFPSIDITATAAKAKSNGGSSRHGVAIAGEHLRNGHGSSAFNASASASASKSAIRPGQLASPSLMMPMRSGNTSSKYGRQHPVTPPAQGSSSQAQRPPPPMRRQQSSPSTQGFPPGGTQTVPTRPQSLRRQSGKGDSLIHRRMDFGMMAQPLSGRPVKPVAPIRGATQTQLEDDDSAMSPLVTGAVQYAQKRADRAPHVRSKYYRPSTIGPAPLDVDPFADDNEAEAPAQHERRLPYGRLMPLSPSMKKTTSHELGSPSIAIKSVSSTTTSAAGAADAAPSPRSVPSPPARRNGCVN